MQFHGPTRDVYQKIKKKNRDRIMCPRPRVLVVETRIFLLPPRKPERSVTPDAPQQQRTIFEFVCIVF